MEVTADMDKTGEALDRRRPNPVPLPYVAAENVVISTDCGMKYLPRESAEGRMRRMAGAAQLLREEYG
jgi:methionine synthase II (cobalamin-independent)